MRLPALPTVAADRGWHRFLASGLLWLGLLWSLGVNAAGLTPLNDYYRETWTTRSGLPHNSVNDIAQTPDGYLWLATWEGAVRFNGQEFVNFDRERIEGLPDSGIRALMLDSDGSLLLGGSRGGLVRGMGNQWSPFAPAPALISELLRDRRGRLWVGTEGSGVMRINPDGSRRVYTQGNGLLGNTSLAFAEDGQGRVWVGTSGGLVYFDGDTTSQLPEGSGLPDMPILALAMDQQQRLLVGTERGVFVADLAQPELRFATLHPQLTDEPVTRLLADTDGSLWIGTLNRGLLRLSELGIEQLGVEQGLPNSRVLALLRDAERNLWVGTNGGLFRLSDAPLSSLTQAKGLSDNFVRSVLEHSDGSLWIGTSRGLNRLVGNEVTRIGVGTAFEHLSVLSLAETSTGDVWAGTYTQGAVRWRNGKVVERLNRESGLTGNEVRAVLVAQDGTMWLGSTSGVSHVRDGGIRKYTRDDGLPGTYVVSLAQTRNGDVWVGTGTGAGIIGKDGVRSLDLMSVNQAEFVFDIFEDAASDVVWLATDRGLVRFRNRDGQMGVVGRAAGLPFDKVFHVVLDQLGSLWLSGNRGVVRIDKSQAEEVADGRRTSIEYERYTEADGMSSSQCNGGSHPSATLRGDGSVWLATAIGVAHVQPARISEFSAVPPPVAIESFRVDGAELALGQHHDLAAGTQRIELQFAGLSFRTAQRIRYRYRLLGFDRDWVERGNQSHAEFTNLPPGDYVFQVAAAHPKGGWSPVEATISFRIAPFFWQRPVFWLLAVVGVLALLYAFSRWRLRQMHARQRLLKELVESRTSDLRRQTEKLLSADAEKTVLLEKLREQSEAFERQAREDALTGLMNRRAFDEVLAHEFERARRTEHPLCLALLDIDHFKRVNDEWSHAVGDEALKAVAAELRRHFRSIDAVARWGGEEFAILMPYTSLDEARAAAERLRLGVERMDCDGFAPGLKLTVSIGLSSHVGLSHHEKLVSRADAELYKAKQAGRNRTSG